MILFGASGHAKVICGILEAQGIGVSYLVDADPTVKQLLSHRVVHQSEFEQTEEQVIISIGSNQVRKKLSGQYPLCYGMARHPDTTIDPTVSFGIGTVVMAGAIVNSSTDIGEHCIINTSASVDHDCSIKDFVHISPNSTLCGGIEVGEGTQIGAGATVIPNIKIGKWAVIGAGAVVISDIPDYALAVGNPARIIKYNEPKN